MNRMAVVMTAEQLGLKTDVVNKVVRQYSDAVKKIMDRLDFENISIKDYKSLPKKGIYIPGLGEFVFNWKIIEAYQNKYNKKDAED